MSVRANLLNMYNGISSSQSEIELLERFWAVFPFWCKNKKAVFFLANTSGLKKISKKWIHMSVRADLLNMNNGISGFLSENEWLERFWAVFPFWCKSKKLYFFSLILLDSKTSQKSRSTCPWEPIYWLCTIEFHFFFWKSGFTRGLEPFFILL